MLEIPDDDDVRRINSVQSDLLNFDDVENLLRHNSLRSERSELDIHLDDKDEGKINDMMLGDSESHRSSSLTLESHDIVREVVLEIIKNRIKY